MFKLKACIHIAYSKQIQSFTKYIFDGHHQETLRDLLHSMTRLPARNLQNKVSIMRCLSWYPPPQKHKHLQSYETKRDGFYWIL